MELSREVAGMNSCLFVHANCILGLVHDASAACVAVLLATRLVSDLLARRLLAVWNTLTAEEVSNAECDKMKIRRLTEQPCRQRR